MPAEEAEDEDKEELGDDMKITSLQSITDFLTCAGKTLPDNIRLWARRNLAVARSHESYKLHIILLYFLLTNAH